MVVENKLYMNFTAGLYWLDLNEKYENIWNYIANSTQQEIYQYLQNQSTDNKKWFCGVLVTCIFTVLGCPTVLFWYVLKSDRLMQKVRRFNKELKMKVNFWMTWAV